MSPRSCCSCPLVSIAGVVSPERMPCGCGTWWRHVFSCFHSTLHSSHCILLHVATPFFFFYIAFFTSCPHRVFSHALFFSHHVFSYCVFHTANFFFTPQIFHTVFFTPCFSHRVFHTVCLSHCVCSSLLN